MKKLLLIFLLIPVLASSQWLEMGKQKIGNKVGIQSSGVYQWALDFDGSTEYLSCTPALRLTGEYSLVDNFSDGNYDGWTVSSGAYSVVDSVPLSGGTKSLKCTTAGVISIPCNQAYGSWEFDWYKGGANNAAYVYYINNKIDVFPNIQGYWINISDDERVYWAGRNNSSSLYTYYSASSYVSNSIWCRIKITRNTNGQFHVYIKGGTFGSDYVLVSVTGGSGTNPVTDNTYTTSNYFVLDLDANDMIANIVCQQGEGSLDLNSYERIYHSDNRNFTKTGGLVWVGAGNHSIDTTSTDKRTGTYSGRVISTDVGDSTTNFVNLPTAGFDTLKQDINGVYEKYTLELWCKSKTLSRVIIKIGNQVKTSDTISNIAFEKVVFNFQSNALVSNQPILIYLNQADTVYLDDVSLTKSYDVNYNAYFKNKTYNTTDYIFSSTTNGVTLFTTSELKVYSRLYNNEGLYTSTTGASITQNVYTLASLIARQDSLLINTNGVFRYSSLFGLGKSTIADFKIGWVIGGTYMDGYIGHIQITKFTDISQSNVNSTTLTTAYNRGKLIQNEWTGGTPIEVAFYDWKGSTTNEILTDKSGTGNNLTGTNMDINDRIKVRGKFK